MDDSETIRAQEIALDVARRRAAGEKISDGEVLDKYPELADALQKQLQRLRFLDSARSSGVLPVAPEVAVPPPAGSEPDELSYDAGDMRLARAEPSFAVPETSITQLSFTPDGLAEARISGTAPALPFRPRHRKAMAVIKVYHDNQETFDFVKLVQSDRISLGRNEGNDIAVSHDYQMSGRHAKIERRRDGDVDRFCLVDLGSTNGSFVRVEHARLSDGNELLLGGERYQVRIGDTIELQHVLPQKPGASITIQSGQWIGRAMEGGIDALREDPLLDPRHAKIMRLQSGRWGIEDGRSLNGVWMRVQEVILLPRCQFQLGEQRFGFLG